MAQPSGSWRGSYMHDDDIARLVRLRRIPQEVITRTPGEENEPTPEPGERVVFGAHFDRGLGLPASRFFRQFLDFFGLQPHHLPANACVLLSCYVAFMEGYAAASRRGVLELALLPQVTYDRGPSRPAGAAPYIPAPLALPPKIPTVDSGEEPGRCRFFLRKNANPPSIGSTCRSTIRLLRPAGSTGATTPSRRIRTRRSTSPWDFLGESAATGVAERRGPPPDGIEDGDLAHKIWTPDHVIRPTKPATKPAMMTCRRCRTKAAKGSTTRRLAEQMAAALGRLLALRRRSVGRGSRRRRLRHLRARRPLLSCRPWLRRLPRGRPLRLRLLQRQAGAPRASRPKGLLWVICFRTARRRWGRQLEPAGVRHQRQELEPAGLRRLRGRKWFPPGQPRRLRLRSRRGGSRLGRSRSGRAVSPTSLHVAKGARLVSVPSASDSSFGSAGTMEKAWHQADSCEVISREGQPGTAPLKMLFSGYRASLKNKAAEAMAQLATLEDADKAVDERRTVLYNKVVTSYHRAKIERAALARELEVVKAEAARVPQLENDLRIARAQCAESEEAGRAAAAKLKVADGELTRLRKLEANHLKELATLRKAEADKVDDLSKRRGCRCTMADDFGPSVGHVKTFFSR
ncbi:hypothetical protein QYE76_049818 [Lolium multiflorum]|uniref:Transposase (putative) gypsy type domain-containing protein n=1 Tax=Lolium multiflorum TaxID=4521 RepID=A0AAD8WGN6_LOLMU|nr:hypothetical protein QYE76_049818 [Lolium multiflorum]